MSTCERCWADSQRPGSPSYAALILHRFHRCTPEQQAGPDASWCHRCQRRSLHQHTHECMNLQCWTHATDICDTFDLLAQICEERSALLSGMEQAALRAIAKDLRNGEVITGIKQCASCGIWTKEKPDGWDLPDWNYCNECIKVQERTI